METQELQRIKNKFDIIGNDAALNRAIETAMAVAQTDLTVLISGESGVGKENIPRIIHQNSLRKTGKYLAVNCGGLPEGTINSELFGHEKGAFTGAVDSRKGYFEEANGGTLFLDEVGELPPSTQAMLLRVLQNGEYMKVGSSKVQRTDVRVIAATNVNLLYAVSQGKFREDLYYRLNVIPINMPSLRERKDDIYLLFRKFASDFSEKYNVSKVNLSHEAILMLQNYRWPGNIRQLKNVAEMLSAMESRPLSAFSGRTEIDAATLSRYLPKEDPNAIPALSGGSTQDSLNSTEKQVLVKAILDLKQEVDRLKAVVYGSDGQGAPQLVPVSAPVNVPASAPAPAPVPVSAPAGPAPMPLPAEDEIEWQDAEVRESSQAGEDSLSIRKVEEDHIRRALEKHHGNRKLAAAELGISERTLYRRLSKQ
ncbi:MAG: sigma-54-dependent Fis family transcriptional regulator [Bacteroidales bacterium]|nr:sigma-54-dependent Fis family transcriptional regulator [Bacteroidales bacterium]